MCKDSEDRGNRQMSGYARMMVVCPLILPSTRDLEYYIM